MKGPLPETLLKDGDPERIYSYGTEMYDLAMWRETLDDAASLDVQEAYLDHENFLRNALEKKPLPNYSQAAFALA